MELGSVEIDPITMEKAEKAFKKALSVTILLEENLAQQHDSLNASVVGVIHELLGSVEELLFPVKGKHYNKED